MASYAWFCVHWKWPTPLHKLQLYFVILSCFVLNLIFGSYSTFGNLLPYIVSYIRERSSPLDLNLAFGTYIFAAQLTGFGCAIILGGVLDCYAGPRVVVLSSGAIVCIGIFLTYFTIQYSFWLMVISYGLVYGIGNGLSYMSIVACAVKWRPQWKGLVSGIVLSGIGISPFIFNAIQTGFINPLNKSPDYAPHRHENYFTQSDVLDRIPYLFLLLGIIYLFTISLASVFITLPLPTEDSEEELSDKGKSLLISNDDDFDEKKCTEDEANVFHPLKMFKSFRFYHICTMFILGVTIHSFVLSLYKSFAFEEITNDDHFLTIAGSTSAMFNFLGHIIWGLLVDLIDYKFAIVFHSSYITVIMLTLYATTTLNKIAFFVTLCGLFFGIGGYFSIFPAVTAEYFGHKHLAINYGIIVGISEIIGSVYASVLSHTLLNYIHWYGIFFFLGGVSFIELILALFLHVCCVKKKTDDDH